MQRVVDSYLLLGGGEDSDSNGDTDEHKEIEIRFAPVEGTNVRDLFDCIQACNQLHPGANGEY